MRKGEYLSAYTSRAEPDNRAVLPQPDYGTISAIQIDRTGGLIAIGDQISYRITVEVVDGRARFGQREELPALFGEWCGPITHLVGACWTAGAVFSQELRAGLIEGLDYLGRNRHFAVGLNKEERVTEFDIPEGNRFRYRNEVPGSGGVLFRAPYTDAYLFFDGEKMHPCPPSTLGEGAANRNRGKQGAPAQVQQRS